MLCLHRVEHVVHRPWGRRAYHQLESCEEGAQVQVLQLERALVGKLVMQLLARCRVDSGDHRHLGCKQRCERTRTCDQPRLQRGLELFWAQPAQIAHRLEIIGIIGRLWQQRGCEAGCDVWCGKPLRGRPLALDNRSRTFREFMWAQSLGQRRDQAGKRLLRPDAREVGHRAGEVLLKHAEMLLEVRHALEWQKNSFLHANLQRLVRPPWSVE